MSEGIFSKYEREELNKVTAKSILEKLMNIRQSINVEFTARRLIWELIQNAKDNVYLCNIENQEKVDISIDIDDEWFIFSHNKGYFTNEQVRGLIRKYSSSDKERDPENRNTVYKTTGQFGTGFMTTHLLSEIIQVESYYKNEQNKFKKFSFTLDRQGKNEKQIVAGINKAFEEAEGSIKESEEIESFDKSLFKTSFFYPLKKGKRELAEIALQEVEKGIGYTLINVPEINQVRINNNIYKIKKDEKCVKDIDFSVYHLHVNGKKRSTFLTHESQETKIIIPIRFQKDTYFVEKIEESIPRFHLDFPMIGTEIEIPFIVNNPMFEPTEPRDGISLKGDDNETSELNSNILLDALQLYYSVLEYTAQSPVWKNLYNLARIGYRSRYWIDESWFRKSIIEPTKEKLLIAPIVEIYSGGKISILNDENKPEVYFPKHEKPEIRERIWELTTQLYPENTPVMEHIHDWYSIIWKPCYEQTLSELSCDIQNQKNINGLANALSKNEDDAILFLNSYYDLLNFENIFIKDIATDEFKVIPNQYGEFIEKSKLFIENNIDNELKNVCALLTEDPRYYLRHLEIVTATKYEDNIDKSILKYNVKTQDDLIQIINTIIKDGENENILSACAYLVSLKFDAELSIELSKNRDLIYAYSERLYPTDFTERRYIEFVDKKIWEESDKNSIYYIVSKISEYQTIDKAINELEFSSKKEFATWLNPFIDFIANNDFENNLNRKKDPILPNQNGLFKIKDDLFLDSGDIDEELKDISRDLGYDFRNLLLEPSIFLELPEGRTIELNEVADKISSLIKPMIKDVDKRKEYAATLNSFYVWMNNNRDKAIKYFADLYEYKFLFFTDEEITENILKANQLDKLMSDYNINDIDELRYRLSLTENKNFETESAQEITQETLVSLGITTQEELDEALKDPEISSKFKHESTHTTEMFVYAQGIIERAKKNIIKHLETLPDYDCSDYEETAPTIIAGIEKKGIPIQIVARPSDNGEVIIYYSSEKDTLDCEDSELWVDNDIRKPHIVTLGRVLKTTGIEKIPIELNE